MSFQCWFGVIFYIFFPLFAIATEKVVVIGGGPAGVAAAYRLLQQKDGLGRSLYDVIVFEKTDRVGGKCFSLPTRVGSQEGVVELGAIQVGPGYKLVMQFSKEVGNSLRDYWVGKSLHWAVDSNGNPSENPAPVYVSSGSEYTPWSSSIQIARETKILDSALKRFQAIADSHLEKIPVESEFNQPFETWADQVGLPYYKEMFRIWMTSYGYGLLKDIPAYIPLYAIGTSSGQVMMLRFNVNMRMLSKGFGGLIQEMADQYHIPIETEVTVEEIVRDRNQVTLRYRQNGQIVTKNYDRLVVACGLECVQDVIQDKSKVEQELMDLQVFSPYDVVIADVPALPKGGYVIPQNLDRPGHVALISKNSAAGEDAILYIPRGGVRRSGEPSVHRSEVELTQQIQEDMGRFGFRDVTVSKIQYWDAYFPHFNDPTAYTRLEQIQGQNRTIYVGGGYRFEYVENSMSHAIDTVEKHILINYQAQPAETFWQLGLRMFNWYFSAQKKEVVH